MLSVCGTGAACATATGVQLPEGAWDDIGLLVVATTGTTVACARCGTALVTDVATTVPDAWPWLGPSKQSGMQNGITMTKDPQIHVANPGKTNEPNTHRIIKVPEHAIHAWVAGGAR